MGIRSLLRNAFGRSKATREESGTTPSGTETPEPATPATAIPEAREESAPGTPTDRAAAEAPATEEPAAEAPAAEQPTTERPVAERPVAEVPAARTAPQESTAEPESPTVPAQAGHVDHRAERPEPEQAPKAAATPDDAPEAVAAVDESGTATATAADEALVPNEATTPTDEDTVPTDGDTVPTDEDTVPTDEDTVPTDGDTTPTDGDTVPGEATAEAPAADAPAADAPAADAPASDAPAPDASVSDAPVSDATESIEARKTAETAEATEATEATVPTEVTEAAQATEDTEAPQGNTALHKVEATAPALVSLVKSAAATLDKHGLTAQRAAVYLVLDRSGSMRNYYKDGTVQHLAEQALGLSANLDDDGIVPVVFFSTDVDGTADLDLTHYEGRIAELHAGLGHMGRTNYHWAIDAVVQHYKKSGTTAPAFVIFQTDGAPTSRPAAERALCEAAELPIFWQFIGFGDPDAKGFDFLRKLDDLAVPEKRVVDNAGFFHAGRDPRALSSDELYQQLMVEFPEWLTEARTAGVLKDN
ncbi:vWA domain-containing protein [Streptomyces benahoarensis]|uniref:VWA domain-containing protein n=1 Tax=Streptomyces benahoarensis TaxID=2595054 RepID=A0A553YZU4_9ACTN|nr:VWA domain-containing protein [Streptomyces benahoarensis]TSB18079.1 VWA domain-containing protein [Streptomyces benahoarensis]TSB34746.1 VWA domain-containing protein [Streptomyces benahoarensis]